MAAKKRNVHIKALPDLRKDKVVQHTIEDLATAASDAIQETLAYYLASPDTLRTAVKEEIGRNIGHQLYGLHFDKAFLETVTARARDLAVEEFNKPENFDLLADQLKGIYIAELKKELQNRVKSRASLDAHEVYSRAWKPYGR